MLDSSMGGALIFREMERNRNVYTTRDHRYGSDLCSAELAPVHVLSDHPSNDNFITYLSFMF